MHFHIHMSVLVPHLVTVHTHMHKAMATRAHARTLAVNMCIACLHGAHAHTHVHTYVNMLSGWHWKHVSMSNHVLRHTLRSPE